MTRTCPVCGTSMENRRTGTLCCSRKCYKKHYYRNKSKAMADPKRNREDPQDRCPHNVNVQCRDTGQCHRCGWNPEVEAARKAALAEKEEVVGREAEHEGDC